MSRYVEYDSLVADSYESDMWDRGTQRFNLRIVEVDDIEKAPSIDLVRCGECKWADNCSQNVAMRESYQMYEKLNFCSYGERKEGE